VDSNGDLTYKLTTDAANWGAPVSLDSARNYANVAVWYDQWTPGDTTGVTIHIATVEPTNDDLWYMAINSRTGAVSTALTQAIPGTSYGPGSDGNAAITKATNGNLFIGTAGLFGPGNVMMISKCTGSCGTSGNWVTTNFDSTFTSDDGDTLQLFPIADGGNGDILAVIHDEAPPSGDVLESIEYDEQAGPADWDGATLKTIDGIINVCARW